MKKYSEIFESNVKQKLDIQDNTINYISIPKLKEYLEITDKFISDEAKSVIQYLINNNETYISELSNDTDENALAGFYNNGVPSEDKYKELYKNIGILNKKNKLMEIPVFQTKEQFEAIINKTESPDMVILDLETEAGRNAIAKKYEPLVHKMAQQFLGKSNLDYEELLSAAYQGLVWAMNGYGKKTKKNNAGIEQIVSKTFTQYAAYIIRVALLEDIKHLSRTVRVPLSVQNAERAETGYNTKSNTISGDKEVGSNGEDGNKSLFDYVGSVDTATRNIDNEDLDNLWKKLFNALEKKFDKKMLDVWYSSYGLNGYEKLKKKDIAVKYGVVQGSISYYLYKINNFINTDKRLKSMITDIFELMTECKHDEDMDYDPEETVKINIYDNE